MKEKIENNKKIENDNKIRDLNYKKIDYGYDYTPSLANSPNPDELKQKAEELDKISKK